MEVGTVIQYHDLNREIAALSFQKRTERSKYYMDIITFDIETTSYNKYVSFMYVWQICINGRCFYGRKWEEFIEFIKYLQLYNGMFVVWVHNLSFEFSFIQDLFKWDNVFAINFHKPIYAKSDNVIFRCSYLMSNLSLEKLGENYELSTRKLKDTLDYSLIRHQETELTETDLNYCENDVRVLYEYIDLWLRKYQNFSPAAMPLTSTGYTRKYLRDKASEDKQFKALRSIVSEASPRQRKLYNLLQRAFAGGYTHANFVFCKWCFEPRKDGTGRVKSRDKTSFYPAIMVKEKFPRKFVKIKKDKVFQFIKLGYAVIMDVCFKNIRAKGTLTTISEHKCALIKKGTFDNGRVYSAELLVTSITELDLDTITKVYAFDSISIGNAWASKKRYLPKVMVETVLDLYEGKTQLKDVEGKEQEYQRLKALLNSLYGMCVTDIMRAIIIFMGKGEWEKQEAPDSVLLDYIKNPNSILLYQTGMYVTAYARHELLEHNIAIGDDKVVYNDTDSIKYLYDEGTEKYFEEYDKKVLQQLHAALRYQKIDPERISPVDIYGKQHTLGMMSDEGNYLYFKTLGSKRYIGIKEGKGRLECTVAGVPKAKCAAYLLSGLPEEKVHDDNPPQGPPTIQQAFRKFCNQMYIPSSMSGKYTHYYTCPTEDIEVEDYTGKKAVVSPGFGISLQPQPFEINLSAQYKTFLVNRITVEGVSHCERLEDLREFTKIKTLWEDLMS
jgi:hypothetical protein